MEAYPNSYLDKTLPLQNERLNLEQWIELLLSKPALTGMGHDQSPVDNNLGLGWLYYALGRVQRAQNIVVIGSYRGFAPLIFSRSQSDNEENGQLLFIDPSYADNFWTDSGKVDRYFSAFGQHNIQHYRETTQGFVTTPEYNSLCNIGLLFIDGHHTYEQARYDFDSFEMKMASDGLVLLHDSAYSAQCDLYGGKEGFYSDVPKLVNELRQRPDLQVFDLHIGSGVALVGRVPTARTTLHPL